MKGLGEKLRARARELGLSDVEVARRLGLSQSRYANYVLDKREPDLGTFVRICQILGTAPNALLGFGDGDDDGSPEASLRSAVVACATSLDRNGLRTLADVASALAARHRREVAE